MGCGGSKADGTQPVRRRPAQTKGRTVKYDNKENDDDYDESNNRPRGKVPVNEKGYKKRIRENLRQAAAGNDIEELERNMEIFVNNRMVDGGDYAEAERRLDFLLTRKDIRDACMRRHPDVLEKAIQKVEASPYKRQLKPYLDRAYLLKKEQNQLETYRHDIGDIDQETISEIRSYHHPKPPVHTTMIASCMLLGYPEDHLVKDWTEITAIMSRYGKDSFLREVRNVDTSKIDNTTGLRARNYLCQYTLDEVRLNSNGAASFYVWASKIVGKYEGKGKKGADTQPKALKNSGGKGPGNSQPVTPASQTKPSNKTNAQDNKTSGKTSKKG